MPAASTPAHDKVAIITGAGSGVGRAVALAFLKDGYRTVLAGRRADALEETIALSGVAAGRALAVPTDVTERDGLGAGALRQGRPPPAAALDLLFNNAGVGAPRGMHARRPLAGGLAEGGRRQSDRPVPVHAGGVQGDARPDARSGGRIINNGSISAHAPRPNSVAYTATKHAITGLTKTASLDGRKYGIAVGQVDIGNAADRDGPQRMTTGVPQPDGSTKVESRAWTSSNVADSRAATWTSLPLGGERALRHGDGDDRALRRAGLIAASCPGLTRASPAGDSRVFASLRPRMTAW